MSRSSTADTRSVIQIGDHDDHDFFFSGADGAALPDPPLLPLLQTLSSGTQRMAAWLNQELGSPAEPEKKTKKEPPPKAAKAGRPAEYRKVSKAQRESLEAAFQRCPKPDADRKRDVAREIGMTYAHVKTWFSNRRTKERKLREAAARQAKDRKAAGGADSGDPVVSILKKLQTKASTPRVKAQLGKCIQDRAPACKGTRRARR